MKKTDSLPLQGLQTGLLVGVLVGLAELLTARVSPMAASRFFLIERIGLNVAIYSGGLWAAVGGLIGLLFQIKTPQKASKILHVGLIAFPIALCHSSWSRPFLREPLALFTAPWTLTFVTLFLGLFVLLWYVPFPRIRRRAVHWVSTGLIAVLFGGYVARVAEIRSWHREPSQRPMPSAEAPNVLLIVVDSLRSDALGLSGSPGQTSPAIDQLFKEGAVAFKEAAAGGSWTRPTVASLVTGTFFPQGELHDAPSGRLIGPQRRLTERFHEAGYSTVWISANHWASPAMGMAPLVDHLFIAQRTRFPAPITLLQDFDGTVRRFRFLKPVNYLLKRWAQAAEGDWMGQGWTSDTDLANAFLRWHEKRDQRPWMAYIHSMAVHWPWGDYGPDPRQAITPDSDRWTNTPDHDLPASLADQRQFAEAYRHDVRYADQQIGRILDRLRATGELDRTIVVITADHGEAFGEHGAQGHSTAFHREVHHIPLLIRAPGWPGPTWVDVPVHQIDILPTLLSLAGLPRDRSLYGMDLGLIVNPPPGMKINRERSMPFYFARNTGAIVLGMRRGDYQYYRWARGQTTYRVLHDLKKDPAERVNVINQHSELVKRLELDMKAWGMDDPRVEP